MTERATKRERQQLARDQRAADRARAQRRATLTRVLAPIGIVALVVLIVVAVSLTRASSTGPSPAGSITIDGAAMTATETAQGVLDAGQQVPGFTAPALGGGTVKSDPYRGAPFVLVVWAPWCPHCQAELPVVKTVADRYPDIPVVTVATSIGRAAGPTPEEFMAQRGLTYPVAVDDANSTLAQALGVSGFPTLYLVGSDGKTVAGFTGETPEGTLDAAFADLAARSD